MNNIANINNVPFVFIPKTFDEAMSYATVISKSNLVPKDYKDKPEDVFIAMQWGAELNLKPLQALQNIAVINGRPCLWGDAMLAIVQQHSEYEWHKEYINNDIAYCEVKRKNLESHIASFSLDEAKKANLLGKGPWQSYQKRMLAMRARAFALRNTFADALKGFSMKEEVEDYEDKNSYHIGDASITQSKIGALQSKLKGDPIVIDQKIDQSSNHEKQNDDISSVLDAFSNSIQGSQTLQDLEQIGLKILNDQELNTEDKKQLKIIYNDKIKELKQVKETNEFVKQMDES